MPYLNPKLLFCLPSHLSFFLILDCFSGKGYEGDGGPAFEAGLDLPNAMAFAPGISASKMVIADFGHNAVRVVAPISSCT